ncbi:unnamed protein product [Cylindrotheca closterium]|uniref:Uncharacterized protein n=1 Tax=Cylindrotheca closterium TaxID=2856 RepID=A0AAD2FYM4_9STRA|nr:unnamed protein product [Cylindrotheca closterium]
MSEHSHPIIVTTVTSDSDDDDDSEYYRPSTVRKPSKTKTVDSSDDDDDEYLSESSSDEEEDDQLEEDDDHVEDDKEDSWVPVQHHVSQNSDMSSVSDISDDEGDEAHSSRSSSSSSETSLEPSDTESNLSEQQLYVESRSSDDDEEDAFHLPDDDDYRFPGQEDGASFADDMLNSREMNLVSTEMLAPLEPPIATEEKKKMAKEPLVFASDMLARGVAAAPNEDYEENEEDVESTKQQAPLESPYAQVRKRANMENMVDSEPPIVDGNKLPPRQREEEDEEERKRNEFMQWRRTGVPEYIYFEFGKDDCPTDDEDESKSKEKKKKQQQQQQQPTRRRLNPPPPPPKPIVGGVPVKAIPVGPKNNSRMPANARDVTENNNPKEEKKVQGFYKKYRIRASKSGSNKTPRPTDAEKANKRSQRSLSPVPNTRLGGKQQSFRKSEKTETEESANGGDNEKPATRSSQRSTSKRISQFKKGGAKKLQSLRKILGSGDKTEKNNDPIPTRSAHSEPKPEPVKAVPVKRGRSRRQSSDDKNPRLTSTSRDKSVDENPYTNNDNTPGTTTTGRKGRRGKRTVPSPIPPHKTVSSATGRVQSPRVPFRKQPSLKSLNGTETVPLGPDIMGSVTPNTTPKPSVRVKAVNDLPPSPMINNRKGRRTGTMPAQRR